MAQTEVSGLERSEEVPLEYQVFTLCFSEPGAISHFVQTIPTEDIGLPDGNVGLNEFYMALCEFYNKTGIDPVDPMLFKSWLQDETDIAAALGGVDGVDAFLDVLRHVETTHPAQTASYVRYRADQKRQKQYAEELNELLARKDLTSAEKARIGLLATQIRTIAEQSGIDPYANVVTAKDIAELADTLWELPDFLQTPFPSLNKALGYTEKGGVVKGALTGILASSGGGKSTMAKVLTNYWVEQGHRVLYVNYEEVSSHWNRVLMTQVTGKNVYMGDEITESDRKAATAAFREKMDEWGDRLVVKHDPDTVYWEDLEQWLRSMIQTGMPLPDAVVIDTIQSMFLKSAGGRPRWGQFEEIMVRLEKLAKDMGSAFIITVQENTNRMKEKRDVVMQSDTGGSIAIVQKCSVTIHVVSVKSREYEEEEETLCELQVPKNRITGQSFSHNPPIVRYNDNNKMFEPYELVEDERYEAEVEDFDMFGSW